MNVKRAESTAEISFCHPVMRELRPHLDLAAFLAAVQRMQAEGYRLIFLADPDVRAVAGYRKMELLATGAILYVDDLVTLASHRSQGYGKKLLDWMLDEAKRLNCKYLELDSGLKRLDAHRFYEKHGLAKAAFHFSIPAGAKTHWTS